FRWDVFGRGRGAGCTAAGQTREGRYSDFPVERLGSPSRASGPVAARTCVIVGSQVPAAGLCRIRTGFPFNPCRGTVGRAATQHHIPAAPAAARPGLGFSAMGSQAEAGVTVVGI